MQPAANQLDPQIVNLARSIRTVESSGNAQAQGKSGEYGLYQFLPSTWNETAPKFGVNVPLQQATPEQQNEVAYKQLSEWKQQNPTWNVGNFASAWNAGPGKPNAYLENNVGVNSSGVTYNTPEYAKNVATVYQQLKQQGTPGTPMTAGVNQSAQSPQGPSVSGFIGNVFNSAGNLIGGLGNAALHPIQTAQNLFGAAAGGVEKAFGANNDDTQKFDNVINYFGQRYGGSSFTDVMSHIGNTLYKDPVGAALDVSTLLDGFSGALGAASKIGDFSTAAQIAKGADIAKASDYIATAAGLLKGDSPEAAQMLAPGVLESTGKTLGKVAGYTNPVSPIINGATGLLGLGAKTVGYLGSKVIGEDLPTLVDLVKNPQDYSKAAMEANSRGGLVGELGDAVDTAANSKNLTGAEYTPIRDLPVQVTVLPEKIQQIFSEHGLDVTPTVSKGGGVTWKMGAPTADTTLSSADVAHFQKFLDQFATKTQLSTDQLLNARSVMSGFAKYEGKTSDSTALARDLRGAYEKAGDAQVPGLQKLDERMAPQLQQWKMIQKNFLSRDSQTGEWVLRDNAASKMANALNKPQLLKQLEQLVPGITRKIEILKNVENIEKSMGIKVGTYTKSLMEGGALATGNIPLAIGMIIAHPSIANQILRGFGYVSKATVIPILGAVRALIGAVPGGVIDSARVAGKASLIANKANSNQSPQGR